MTSRQVEDDLTGRIVQAEHDDNSPVTEYASTDLRVSGMGGLWEVIGRLVRVGDGEVIIEATRRFVIAVDGKTAKSLKAVVGRKVGVLCIDGKTKWRLLRPSSKRARMAGMSEQER